eukprot:1192232-Prorocentrum_minimum.AAC.4
MKGDIRARLALTPSIFSLDARDWLAPRVSSSIARGSEMVIVCKYARLLSLRRREQRGGLNGVGTYKTSS